MLTWLLLTASAAAAPLDATCTPARVGEVVAIPPPAVVVLGERKGTQPDLVRAERILSRLAARGPVTLALEAVHRDAQPILDQFATTRMRSGDLPDLLRWHSYWGFSWASYERLVTSSVMGAEVVAAGLDPMPRPPDATLPLPPGYVHILADAMGEHPVPVELEPPFVELVAWRDHALARRAIDSWSGEGWLVILADRLHVQGGKGIPWQAAQLTDAPVHAFLLADAGTRCYPEDRVLRDPIDRIRHRFGGASGR